MGGDGHVDRHDGAAEAAGYRQIRYEVSDHVAVITLDRPDAMNAFTPRMARELMDAIDRTDADDDVRAVVVTGAGRAFCAGADLSGGGDTFDLSDVPSDGVAGVGLVRDGEESVPADLGGVVVLRLHRSLKPIIAAVNGSAVGIGLTMTLPMDIRVVADGAKLGFVFVRRGISPDGCATWFLPRLVGMSAAMEWVASGRTFTAAEALHAGLVSSVAPDGASALAAAMHTAREIAANAAPVSSAVSRSLMWQGMAADTPEEAHRHESFALWLRGRSADVREGVSAFLERRPATFPDRVSTSEEVAGGAGRPPRS